MVVLVKDIIKYFTSDNAIILVTYLSLAGTLFFSLRKPHMEITYKVFKNKNVYALQLWNSGSLAIKKEDIYELYMRLNNAYEIINILSSEENVPLKIKEHKESLPKVDFNTIRLDLSFDFMLPRAGYFITLKNIQDDTHIPERIIIEGRLRGEHKNTFLYDSEGFFFRGVDNIVLQCIEAQSVYFLIMFLGLSAITILLQLSQLFVFGYKDVKSVISIFWAVLFMLTMNRVIKSIIPERNIVNKSKVIIKEYNLMPMGSLGEDYDLVRTEEEILYNTLVFDKYLKAGRESEEYRFAIEMVRNSKNILVMRTICGYRFYPGSFIGISYNSMKYHKNMPPLGRQKIKEINETITKILNQNMNYEESLETEYRYYCQIHGEIIPQRSLFEIKRLYWQLDSKFVDQKRKDMRVASLHPFE